MSYLALLTAELQCTPGQGTKASKTRRLCFVYHLSSLHLKKAFRNQHGNECCRGEYSSVCTGLRAGWPLLKSYPTIEVHEGILLKYFKTCS